MGLKDRDGNYISISYDKNIISIRWWIEPYLIAGYINSKDLKIRRF